MGTTLKFLSENTVRKCTFGKSNGIRFSVIHQNEVLQAWCDSCEAFYGPPTCPKCGNKAKELPFKTYTQNGVVYTSINIPAYMDEWECEENESEEFFCKKCKYIFGNESAFPESPLSYYIDDGEYVAECGEDGDIFITKLPYYTLCQYCSPCAPGAGYLMNPTENGVKTYCFGHDFFDDGKAPYPVYNVKTDELMET